MALAAMRRNSLQRVRSSQVGVYIENRVSAEVKDNVGYAVKRVFGNTRKPAEILRKLIEKLNSTPGSEDAEFHEKVGKYLQNIKQTFASQDGQDVDKMMFYEAMTTDKSVIPILVNSLKKVDFESKKVITQIITVLVSAKKRGNNPWSKECYNNAVDTFREQDAPLITHLVKNYEVTGENSLALNSGAILRELAKTQVLAEIMLRKHYKDFFEYANMASFDILSDAFSTLKDLLTRHSTLVINFLVDEWDVFCPLFNKRLIKSDNYVTKRQSIKLISEILMQRDNYRIMTKYVADADNLKVIMTLLCDTSEAIEFEAFHVFKIFVANPNKSEKVLKLLLRNKEQLIKFLKEFQVTQRLDDEQFNEERTYIIKQIKDLKEKEKPVGASTDTTVSSGASSETTISSDATLSSSTSATTTTSATS